MKNLLIFMQINPADAADVKTILVWIVSSLLVGSGIVVRYLWKQNDDRIKDFKQEISDLKTKLDTEEKYNKGQALANIVMITDVQNLLRSQSKTHSENASILKANDEILKTNADRLEDLHKKVT